MANTDPISAKIKGYKFVSNVAAVLLGLFMAMGVFFGFSLFRNYSIPSDGSVVVKWQGKEYPAGEFYRKVLPEIQRKLPFMPFDRRTEVESFIRGFKKNLSLYYPKFPLLPWVITRYPGGKKWALSGYALSFLLTIVPPIVILRRYKTLRKEAFRVAEIEPPVPLGKPDSSLINWKEIGLGEEDAVRELFGGDWESYREVLAYFDGQIISDRRVNYLSECPKKKGFVCYPVKEINETAGALAKEVVDYGLKRRFLTKEDKKLALMTYFFAFVHYASRQFGNIPVGYLNTKMKNPVAKRFFSNYYLERLMLLDNGATEEEIKASKFLEAFYFYSRRKEKNEGQPPLKELRFKFRQVPPATFMEFKEVKTE